MEEPTIPLNSSSVSPEPAQGQKKEWVTPVLLSLESAKAEGPFFPYVDESDLTDPDLS